MAVYDRLYFDFNHNGDLTDDKVIEAKVQFRIPMVPGSRTRSSSFRGSTSSWSSTARPSDAAFFLTGYVQQLVGLQLRADLRSTRPPTAKATITLEGKKRHVVLIDFNSNGRFDDEIKIRKDVHGRQRATLSRAGRHAADRSREAAAGVTIRPTT